jgi:hypothetical protein
VPLLEGAPVELGAELEPVELGDELELDELGVDDEDDDEPVVLSVELELEPEVDGVVADGADGVVLGDADGVVRSAGRSPTRSVRVSLQAVSRPRLSATAKTAVRNFFISMPPPSGVARR